MVTGGCQMFLEQDIVIAIDQSFTKLHAEAGQPASESLQVRSDPSEVAIVARQKVKQGSAFSGMPEKPSRGEKLCESPVLPLEGVIAQSDERTVPDCPSYVRMRQHGSIERVFRLRINAASRPNPRPD